MKKFSIIHNQLIENPRMLDTLQEEFMEYQSMVKEEIPEKVWNEASIKESAFNDNPYHMDMVWGHLRKCFPLLAEVAISVLVIPHSNAADERVFSMIRKNKTEFRSALDLGHSLNSIMRVRMSIPEQMQVCYRWNPDAALLKKCKLSCRVYNQAHCSGSKEM